MEHVSVSFRTGVEQSGYAYVSRTVAARLVRNRGAALALSHQIFDPHRSDPDYLIRRARREIIEAWCQELPVPGQQSLAVLDLGGRLQPYRPLLQGREALYIA
ncbi:MAG TPA: hypothetical protein VNK91_13470 [Burkholderiaceae bacterium]|nr:hypothetical protein [Burkholderiaceae bacterium]